MNRVVVLMSTYNGERYLDEQLESIVSQKDVDTLIQVRDDGSSDRTQSILDEWKAKTSLVWYQGENVGPARSFLELLVKAGESDYYAFSDQDDYWLPEKLSAAVSQLEQYRNIPALYFCQTQLTDKNLNKIGNVVIRPLLTFGEALVYQFVGGCTIVINRWLRDIINRHTPQYLSMHDVWIYDVAQAISAKIVFDAVPRILYRQHGDNVTGQSTSALAPWKKRTERLLRQNLHSRSRVAQELYDGYHNLMPDEHFSMLVDFLAGRYSIRRRIQLAHDKRFLCADATTYRNFQLATLLNVY